MKNISLILLLSLSVLCAEKLSREEAKDIRCREKYYNAIEDFKLGKYSKALSTLEVVRTSCIGGIECEDSLYFYLGEVKRANKSYGTARLEYEEVVERYPRSELREKALYYMGFCDFLDAPIIERDDKLLRLAQKRLSAFVSQYPESIYKDSADVILDTIYERLVTKDVQNAEFYEIVEKFESAIIYYESILQSYPETNRANDLNLRIAKNLISADRFAEAEAKLSSLEAQNLFSEEIKALREKSKKRQTELKNLAKKKR